MTVSRIPVATYRLQLHAGFGFEQARLLVPYLEALGITDVYSSPILKSRSASIHGYDVTDHSQINPELGGEEQFDALSDELLQRDMGMIVDVVPNHMEIDDPANAWWQDVLQNGPSSPFANAFDIDWSPPKADLRNRVLLPVLGDQFGKVLEDGHIRLLYEAGSFAITYFDHRFPVDPRSTAVILETVAEHVRFTSDPEDADLIELESILTQLRYLPERTEEDPHLVKQRRRESAVAKRRLAALTESSASVRRAIEGVVVDWCGRPGDPESFDRLEMVLRDQAYRPCNWRVAADEINYRRFFDINDLAAIRVEDPAVFVAVHETILRLVGEGRITGLRIDHPDGLYDPESYFAKLQYECRRLNPSAEPGARLPNSPSDSAMYMVAEKILSLNEQLPINWAIHGTTGYEMLNLINGLFVDGRSRQVLHDFYMRINPPYLPAPVLSETAPSQTEDLSLGGLYEDLVYQCKKAILNVSMSSELHVLARRLDRVSEQHRWSRDFTLWGLHEALREVIACFPVYRTYVQAGTSEVSDEERRHIDHAIDRARRRNPAIDRSIFDFIESVLLLEAPDGLSDGELAERREFVLKLQQLTGPVMAKGLEDTAFYRVYPLVSLNEVGGEPERFNVGLDEFHRQNTVRCARWPYSMIATSTHDTKRSEDVRAWINTLSEVPQAWIEAVQRWQAINAPKRVSVDDYKVPDPNEEYLLYQTLVGIWPLAPASDAGHLNLVERTVAYMEKALREAKVHTSWVSPNLEYEQGVARFIRAVLSRSTDNPFLQQLEEFHDSLNFLGLSNALGQLVLKATVPGVPDFFQGSELWHFALVDPDNRQSVDYARRQELLQQIDARLREDRSGLIGDLLENWKDGRIKLFMTSHLLHLRRRLRDVFLQGEYLVPEVLGDRRDHVCTFLRRSSGQAVLVIVPRHTYQLTRGQHLPLGEVWELTRLVLPEGLPSRWRDVFTHRELAVASSEGKMSLLLSDLLSTFPVTVMESINES